MLKSGSQPASRLRPYQGRAFVIDELEGFRVEFGRAADENVN